MTALKQAFSGATGRRKMNRVLITGGAGFIGSTLCERLLKDGRRVLCIDNFSTSEPANITRLLRFNTFELRTRDVTEPFDVDGPISAVVHLASPASPVDYARLPLETLLAGSAGSLNCLRLAARKGARFVLASTSEVYGDPHEHPQRETYWGNVNCTGPRSMYDEAKRYAEALTLAFQRSHGADVGIARIFNCYGPRMRAADGRVVPTLIRQALTGEALTVTGDGLQTRSLCYVDDLVGGLIKLIDSDAVGPINIGSPHEITILELAHRIRTATGTTAPVTFVERPPEDPCVRCPDITLARNALQWQPSIGLSEGLDRTIQWFVSELKTTDSRPGIGRIMRLATS